MKYFPNRQTGLILTVNVTALSKDCAQCVVLGLCARYDALPLLHWILTVQIIAIFVFLSSDDCGVHLDMG